MKIKLIEKFKKHKTPIYFLNSTLISSVVGILTGFVTYRYVTPDYMGIWVTLTTFTVYATFFRLGIPNGMNRELPYYLGKNETVKAYKFAETTLAYSLFITGLLSILIIGCFVYFNFNKYGLYATDYKQAMFVIALTVVFEPYSTYLSGTFSTSDNFKKLSDIQMIMSLIQLSSMAFVILWGFQGYILRALIISSTNLLLLHVWRPLSFIKPKFSFSIFKNLFFVGSIIFLVSYAFSFIETLPRLYIINYGTAKNLGLFSPIIMLFGIITLIPNTLTNYLYPKFSKSFGANSDRSVFWKQMRLIYILSFVIAIIGSLFLYFLIDYIILLFPKYIEALPYIKLACLPILFVGYKLGNVLCVVFKEWKWLSSYIIIYFILQFTTLYISILAFRVISTI